MEIVKSRRETALVNQEEFSIARVPKIKWPHGEVVHSQEAKGTGKDKPLVRMLNR